MRIRPPVLVAVSLVVLLIVIVGHAAGPKDLLVIVRDGKYGYIDHQGAVVIEPQFIWAEDFWRGLGAVYLCGKWASIDARGGLHPLRTAVDGGLWPRKVDQKFGFVDDAGNLKIAPAFDEARSFSEGLAAVRIGARWGFVDSTGRLRVPAVYDETWLGFHEGLAAVRQGTNWGFVDRMGKLAIPPRFADDGFFREGVAIIDDGRQKDAALYAGSGNILIDKTGRVLARGYELKMSFVRTGLIAAGRNGKWGYLDTQGNVAIPLQFDAVAAEFNEGLAVVRKGKLSGYVNRDGVMVIPPKFDDAGEFSNGLAPVTLAGRTGFADKSGEIAFYLDYGYSPGFLTGDDESNLFIAPSDVSRFFTKDHKFGYVNLEGKVIWGPGQGDVSHPPLFGWTDEDKVESCKGIPESVKRLVATFPDR